MPDWTRHLLLFVIVFMSVSAGAQSDAARVDSIIGQLSRSNYAESFQADFDDYYEFAKLRSAIVRYVDRTGVPRDSVAGLMLLAGHTWHIVGQRDSTLHYLDRGDHLILTEKLSPAAYHVGVGYLTKGHINLNDRAFHWYELAGDELEKTESKFYMEAVEHLALRLEDKVAYQGLNELVTRVDDWYKGLSEEGREANAPKYNGFMLNRYIQLGQTETVRLVARELENRLREKPFSRPLDQYNSYLDLCRAYSAVGQEKYSLSFLMKADSMQRIAKTVSMNYSFYPALVNMINTLYSPVEGRAFFEEVEPTVFAAMQDDESLQLDFSILYNAMALSLDNQDAYDLHLRGVARLGKMDETFAFGLMQNAMLLGHYHDALDYAQQCLVLNHETFSSTDYTDNPSGIKGVQDIFNHYAALRVKLIASARLYQDEPRPEYARWANATLDAGARTVRPDVNISSNLISAKQYLSYSETFFLRAATIWPIIEEQVDGATNWNRVIKLQELVRAQGLRNSLAPLSIPDADMAPLALVEDSLQRLLTLPDTEMEAALEDILSLQTQRIALTADLRKNFARELDFYYERSEEAGLDVAASLSDGTAILYYGYTQDDDGPLIGLLTNQGHDFKQADHIDDLAGRVEEFGQLSKSSLLAQRSKTRRFTKLGNQLYEHLVAPFAEELKQVERLIIMPNDQLLQLPFEALLTDSTRSDKGLADLPYFVREKEISYQQSLASFARLTEKETPRNGEVFAFAPVFSDAPPLGEADVASRWVMDTSVRSVIDDRLQPLPYTEREVNQIGKVWPGANVKSLLREQATRSNLLRAVDGDYQILHFATHGLVNYENPFRSALACTAGAGERPFLTAADIQGLPLNTDLVVLSSCDSGVGQRVENEGMLSLGQAFLYGGAKNVLYSLWKISDQHSSTLMGHFYRELATGADYGQALRRAKLELLKDPVTASPRYWAPFVLFGE